MTFTEALQQYGISHFKENEVLRMGSKILKWEDIPEKLRFNIFPSLLVLEWLRNKIEQPIYINSTFRTPEHNYSIGGEPNSLHLEFNAIDWSVSGWGLKNYQWAALELQKFNAPVSFKGKQVSVHSGYLGVGVYETFLHLDTRRLLHRNAPARWGKHQ